MHLRLVANSIFILIFVGCSTVSTKTPNQSAAVKPQESSDLSWTEARERKARIENVHYDLHVSLSAEADTFQGQSRIQFELRDASKPLRLDFYEGQLLELKANGTALSTELKKTYWIELPASSLKAGTNLIEVRFSTEYSRKGQGLHKFVDPQTREVFLYSQFETFDANRFMPCFDQPDLRATLDLQVEAPANWQVITATQETKVISAGRERRVWTFARTPKIATYLFSLHAGPYRVWTDRYGRIPLRLFARPSMAKYVRPAEWFKITKQGLKFFEAYFAYPYPFKKYDQLFAPEFNAGAMENVASVTFTEHFLARGEVTREQRRSAASTLLHEMAHMWFGDIVTMKWWNDLWLNESFATYMSALALQEATEFKESWQDFRATDKNWAYFEDSLSTTHPIEAPIYTVKEAFANFDGITYGKGAAVLKQLNAFIGPEHFQKGIQEYIRKYAFQNAELKEFIAALQQQTSRNLTEWANLWLRQAGPDSLSAQWSCEGSRLNQLRLQVTPFASSRFRPQTVWVGLYGKDARGNPSENQSVKVDLLNPVTDVDLEVECPEFVYPNDRDEGYFLVQLDPKSLRFATENLAVFSSKLLRTMIWDDLWKMVRAGKAPLETYIALARLHFTPETDPLVLNHIVGTLSGRRTEAGTVLHFWPRDPNSLVEREAFIQNLEARYLSRMKSSKAGSDEQKFWFDNYVGLARSKSALDQLAIWAKSGQVDTSFILDLDRRWTLLKQLARFQHADTGSRLQELKASDRSERGHKNQLAVEAVKPDPAVKQKWVNLLKQPKPAMSFAEARSVLGSIFPLEQKDLAVRFENDFYEYLRSNGDSENEIFVESVATRLAPLNCEAQKSQRLRDFLRSTPKFSPSVARALKMELEEDERCQKVRAMSGTVGAQGAPQSSSRP